MADDQRTYQARRIAYRELWQEDTEKAEVDLYPWGNLAAVDYRPKTSARAACDGSSLFVYMETDETDLRTEARGFGYVHTDSCMEFFFSPDPDKSAQYLNFEFNPAGAMYLSIGTSRYDRAEIREENYPELFMVRTNILDKGWNLEYRIPLFFMRKFFPSLDLEPGRTMRGNFYKCGDNTARPHFGCWSPIKLPKPDFHRPDFFGVIKL